MRQELREAIIAYDPEQESRLREFVATLSFAEVVPAFLRFLVSSDGHIWVEEYRFEAMPFLPEFPPRDAFVRWTVYDPEGILLGDVEVPIGFTVSTIGADYVLGVARDEPRCGTRAHVRHRQAVALSPGTGTASGIGQRHQGRGRNRAQSKARFTARCARDAMRPGARCPHAAR